MTRKKAFRWIICAVFLLVLLLIILTTQYNIYELTPKVCSVMLGTEVTPEDFIES